jgi:uncharacterized protein YcaQ
LKTYELTDRHFQWEAAPKKASETQFTDYLLDRALQAQGLVSLDSVCHLNAKRKPLVRRAIDMRMRRGELIPVAIEGADKIEHWATPADLVDIPVAMHGTYILSPFDPLIIQRKRLKLFFNYAHLFEAYVPKEKRTHGYFGLPVLVDGEIVAVLDLKADREKRELLLQQWSWIGSGKQARHKETIEEALQQFESFQFAS